MTLPSLVTSGEGFSFSILCKRVAEGRLHFSIVTYNAELKECLLRVEAFHLLCIVHQAGSVH